MRLIKHRFSGNFSPKKPNFIQKTPIQQIKTAKFQKILLEPISNSQMVMQRAIIRLEQGATELAGLVALWPRRNAAQTHNCLCPKDLCGTVAPAALVCAQGAYQPIWAQSRLASATVALQTSFICEFEIGSNHGRTSCAPKTGTPSSPSPPKHPRCPNVFKILRASHFAATQC